MKKILSRKNVKNFTLLVVCNFDIILRREKGEGRREKGEGMKGEGEL